MERKALESTKVIMYTFFGQNNESKTNHVSSIFQSFQQHRQQVKKKTLQKRTLLSGTFFSVGSV